jgi:hypothetical protein
MAYEELREKGLVDDVKPNFGGQRLIVRAQGCGDGAG